MMPDAGFLLRELAHFHGPPCTLKKRSMLLSLVYVYRGKMEGLGFEEQ